MAGDNDVGDIEYTVGSEEQYTVGSEEQYTVGSEEEDDQFDTEYHDIIGESSLATQPLTHSNTNSTRSDTRDSWSLTTVHGNDNSEGNLMPWSLDNISNASGIYFCFKNYFNFVKLMQVDYLFLA